MISGYTPYQLKGGKIVNIPNHEIAKLQSLLHICKSEAINVWLSDNDYIVVDEIEELTAKAKENKISHNARAEYKPKTRRERVVKEDKVKENIIQSIADLLPTLNAENVVIANKGKLITFKIGEESFKLDLIRQRPPKTKG